MKAHALTFETSAELKALFTRELRAWSAKHRLGVDELARRCGVSPSYLAHIGRYGRIPGKPVLLLLALNFEMEDPEALLKAALSQDGWPFPPKWKLREDAPVETGFLSVRLDMAGLVEALKGAIRSETSGSERATVTAPPITQAEASPPGRVG